MSNMSYCRFENTYFDLLDCLDHVFDELYGTEYDYRAKLVELAAQILWEVGVAVDVKDVAERVSKLPRNVEVEG